MRNLLERMKGRDKFWWFMQFMFALMFLFVGWVSLISFEALINHRYGLIIWFGCSVACGAYQLYSGWDEFLADLQQVIRDAKSSPNAFKRAFDLLCAPIYICIHIVILCIAYAIFGLIVAIGLFAFLSPSSSDCMAGRYC